MEKGLMQWSRAKYWTDQFNPYIGCRPVSPACDNCYAAAWARRFGRSFDPHKTRQRPPRKGVVFCGNMTDVFGEWRFCCESAAAIGAARTAGGSATYIWLTKRVRRMAAALGLDAIHVEFPEKAYANHWFGFTAESQEWYDLRSDASYTLPEWANAWVSAEPLLGPVDLHIGVRRVDRWDPHPVGFVVVGCESGPKRRPCKVEWVESIVDQCRSAGVPVFVKQLDVGGMCVTDIARFPEHLRIRQVPWASGGEEGGSR